MKTRRRPFKAILVNTELNLKGCGGGEKPGRNTQAKGAGGGEKPETVILMKGAGGGEKPDRGRKLV